MSEPLKAGRELDAVVAEDVFGLVRCTAGYAHGPRGYPNTTCYALPESPDQGGELRCYSTEIAAAWEVVEKCLATFPDHERQAGVDAFEHRGALLWRITLRSGTGADAETAPLAICLAALEAVRARPTEQEPHSES
jgi:hypothetical protein